MYISKKKSYIEQKFIVVMFIGVFLHCEIIRALEDVKTNIFPSEEESEDKCLTKFCNQTAAVILENMDKKINPCDNFYQFACGGFINSHNLNNKDETISVSKMIENHILHNLITSIEKKYSPKNQRLLNLLTNLYNICLEEFSIFPSKRQFCVYKIQSKLPTAMSALYMNYNGKKTIRNRVLKMTNNIRNEFILGITKNDWLEENVADKILLKLNNLSNNVGYPDEIVDEEKLDDYYEKFVNINKQYLDDFFQSQTLLTNVNYTKLIEPEYSYNQNFIANLTKVSGWFSILHNSINIPAGMLQGLYYDKNRPSYMNYGAIGFVIGHELTHGIDNIKFNYSSTGKSHADWWTNTTNFNYKKKLECFIEQYENFTLNSAGQKIDGSRTLFENIADNGGMKAAYLAYKKSARNRKIPELKLPGLESFTSSQMFWISAANSRCSKYHSGYFDDKFKLQSHTPSEFRILGMLSNIKEFSDDFKCQEGTIMNPKTKCSLW